VPATASESLPISGPDDVVVVRQRVRELAIMLGFRLVDQTKLVTAASELARNTLQHGRGGKVEITTLQDGSKKGLRLVFEDQGPGIPDIERALTDGFTTGGGLGLGLGGSKRLCNEFSVESEPGRGTRVMIARWA
jgi:serine/threonine-protein kinase RsbT